MSAPPDSVAVPLRDDSGVGEARRAARALARALGLGGVAVEQVAIVATEAARNAVVHGGGGQLVLTPDPGGAFVDVLALDRGRGIPDLPRAMQDGFSTAGTAGHGLGAIGRTATLLDVYSAAGLGTALLARVGAPLPAGAAVEVGAVSVPVPPEQDSGDAWAVDVASGRVLLLVADGLGHGVLAAEAARAAVAAFRQHARLPPERIVERLHLQLRSTRGAALAVAELGGAPARVRYAGIGNISGVLAGSGKTRQLVSLPGTAGHELRSVRAFEYDSAGDGALVIMHSDGIDTHWDLGRYPGLAQRHPALVAGVLYRDHARRRDDATVLVVRRAP